MSGQHLSTTVACAIVGVGGQMTERSALLAELIRELHGPRAGITELLDDSQNPRDEYIVGVLAPAFDVPQSDNEAEVTEIAADADADGDIDDDEGDPATVTGSNISSPSLDPK